MLENYKPKKPTRKETIMKCLFDTSVDTVNWPVNWTDLELLSIYVRQDTGIDVEKEELILLAIESEDWIVTQIDGNVVFTSSHYSNKFYEDLKKEYKECL
jgi:hypothetical protein